MADVGRPCELAVAGSQEQHLAGTEALPFGDFIALQVGDADFGTDHKQAIGGQRVAKRAQAVAVEFCADGEAVGEDHGCRAIPRLLLRACASKKRRRSARDLRVRFPRGRHHGEHSGFGAEPAPQQQFEAVVEAGGIADAFFEHANSTGELKCLLQAAVFACSQRRLALMVLISPLWATKRKGWASAQLGCVLVE